VVSVGGVAGAGRKEGRSGCGESRLSQSREWREARGERREVATARTVGQGRVSGAGGDLEPLRQVACAARDRLLSPSSGVQLSSGPPRDQSTPPLLSFSFLSAPLHSSALISDTAPPDHLSVNARLVSPCSAGSHRAQPRPWSRRAPLSARRGVRGSA
jgi:hypothetical protein